VGFLTLYHVAGAFTFVNEFPLAIELVYEAHWRWPDREKRHGGYSKRMRLPLLTMKALLSTGDGVLDVGALEAIQPDLDSLIDFALSTDPPTDFGTYLYP
jgi:hypothetical protein